MGKVVITGARGLIGEAVTRLLADRGDEVFAVSAEAPAAAGAAGVEPG